jgi:[acyl-carrier-protein] S-malonyltransferase
MLQCFGATQELPRNNHIKPYFTLCQGGDNQMSDKNAKIILLFPGQGSQYVTMGRDLAENFSECTKIYECGSDILGYDLKSLINDSDETKLMNTEFAQPAIFAASLIALTAARESGVIEKLGGYKAVGGHSLGEYAALVTCGVFDMENGFKAIKARAKIMAKAGDAAPGGMTAVIGASEEQILDAIGENAVIANINSPAQIVIAGELAGLEKAEEALGKLEIKRLKVIRLKTSAAFHTELMRPAAKEFLTELEKLTFNPANCDFYSNVYADYMTGSIPPEYLFAHMVTPVKFAQQLDKIRQDGYDTFIEVGPGKVLSGLIKKTLEDVQVFNIEDIDSLNKLN